ncbi:MAG: antitoxin [Pseudomonadota bacterium]|nr:antitoxin [Pseudomonadota bacterium]
MNDQILTATEASRAFSEMLHRVCYGGESFVIKKGTRLMARITPVEVKVEDAVAEENIALPKAEEIATHSTADEAEFYRAWMEQVRKVEA